MSESSPAELRKMNRADLQKEVREQHTLIQKLRTALRLGKEKNTQKYRSARKQLARMLTIYNASTDQAVSTPAK